MPHSFLKPLTYCGLPYQGSCDPDTLNDFTDACVKNRSGTALGRLAGRPAEAYEWIPFTYPFNMTGQPACSVPAGFTADKLPVGLQIVGRRFDDVTVLRAAHAFERAQPWHHFKPPAD